MNWFEISAQKLKYGFGLKDDSPGVRKVRPYFNSCLRLFYGRRGLPRLMGGQELIRIKPQHRYMRDDYEEEVVRYLRDKLKPGDVVLEVGAHIGLFSVLMARWVGSAGKIYAFEPSPDARAALVDHLSINHAPECVVIREEAISNTPGEVAFYALGASGRSTLSNAHAWTRDSVPIRVSCTTIDEFCAVNKIIPSLIKIDIEGLEHKALQGALGTLSRQRCAVVVEVHPMYWAELGVGQGQIAAMIEEIGYEAISLSGLEDPFAQYGQVLLAPREQM